MPGSQFHDYSGFGSLTSLCHGIAETISIRAPVLEFFAERSLSGLSFPIKKRPRLLCFQTKVNAVTVYTFRIRLDKTIKKLYDERGTSYRFPKAEIFPAV